MDAPGQASAFYGYDAASWLRTITQAPLNPVSLAYDALGRRTLLTLPNGVSTTYQYDTASRLTALLYQNAASVLGNLTYQYDQAGNRIRIGGAFARTLLPDPVPSATYDAANRQLAFGDKAMTFDADGNLTAITDPGGLTSFAWDARDRLTALTGPGVTAAFTYDPLARRLAKATNGQSTQYLYDGLDISQQFDSLGPTSYLRSLNIDEAFSLTNRNGTYSSIYDPLGSALAVADQTGNPLVQYTYEPFGRTSATDPTFPNPFQYTGRENDGTGLLYYRARYYYPGLGRFVSEDPLGLETPRFSSQDPIGLSGRINLYTYVLNNPVTNTDPFGLQPLGVGPIPTPQQLGVPPAGSFPAPNFGAPLIMASQLLAGSPLAKFSQEIYLKRAAFEESVDCAQEVNAVVCYSNTSPLGSVTVGRAPVFVLAGTVCNPFVAVGRKNCCPLNKLK